MVTPHYAIICNPQSGKGKGKQILPRFEEHLRQKEISFDVFYLDLPLKLDAFTTLVIMGGDGTINYVLNHYKQITIPIAFIATGTGNDYATLHLKNSSFQQQFEIASSPQTCFVDAGICNKKIFINGVGIGFDGWVVKKNLGKRFFTGKAAYFSTILSLLLFYKESPYQITIDGESYHDHIFMLSIAKGKHYGGGFLVAPLAEANNGIFDFVGIGKIGLLKRLWYLPVIEKGKHLQLPFVKYAHGKSIHIHAQHPLQAHLDGEWMESQTYTISLLPKAFQIKSARYA